MAPVKEERIGDVSNVLFSNGWITDEDGTVYIYYASSDTRMHVATSTIERLVDYCLHTPEDKLRSATSVENIYQLIEANKVKEKEETYKTVEEAAAILHRDRSSLWRWAKSGYLVPIKVGAKSFYRMSDIKKLMEG